MIQRNPIIATVDSAVKRDMNRDCSNINTQPEYASKISDGGSDEQVVDEIEVRNENSGFSGRNSAQRFDLNLTPQSINVRYVDDITGTGSQGLRRIRPNGIKTIN